MVESFMYQHKTTGIIHARRYMTPQTAGRCNAQNRKDGAEGTWIKESAFTFEELAKRSDDFTTFDEKGIQHPESIRCPHCFGHGWIADI